MKSLDLCTAVVAALCVCPGLASAGTLFQPDSAIAGSEFSNSYLITNAINGSGLPAGFDLDSVHSTYVQNNHWTTRSGALAAGDAWAQFFFDAPVTIGNFHMWNHLSNGVASDPGYAITLFNLELYDADDVLLESITNVSALPNIAVAQSFSVPLTENVSSVILTILANNGSPRYTGLAEVAFDSVPAPGSFALIALGGLAASRRRR